MKKNTMIRNLLYSICLHLSFLIFVIFSENINNAVNNQITNINLLNVDRNFLLVNDIKTTDKDIYSNLTLSDKVDLYNLSKQHYDKNKKISTVDYSKNDDKYRIKHKDLEPDNKNSKKPNNKNDKNNVIYLGRNDYKKYQERKELEKMMAEESKRLENLVTEINITTNNTNSDKNEANKEGIKKSNESREIDKQIAEILSKNNTNKEKEAIVEKKEEKEIEEENLNIDINKIFTNEDVKQIKKYLQNESNSQALSVREKLNIQNQISMCYKNALIKTGKTSKVKVSVTLKLFYDGIIDTKEIKIKIIDDNNTFTKEDYSDAIENVKIALAYCNPLRNLPATKYQSWQNINFIFDATN